MSSGIDRLSSSTVSIDKPEGQSCCSRFTLGTLPTLLTISCIAEAALSAYYFNEANRPLAWAFTGLAAIACCTCTGYWRTYIKAEWNEQAKSLAKQLGVAQELEQQRSKAFDQMTKEKGRLAAKVDQLNAKLNQEQAHYLQRERELMDRLEQAIAGVRGLPQLADRFKDTAAQIAASKEGVKEKQLLLDQKIAAVREVIGVLEQLPETLMDQIQKLQIQDDQLDEKVVQVKDVAEKLDGAMQELLAELAAAHAERTRFTEQLGEFREQRQQFQSHVEKQSSVVERFRKILNDYQKERSSPKKSRRRKKAFALNCDANKSALQLSDNRG